MRELLERNVIVQNAGGGRSTSYRLAGLEEEQVPVDESAQQP